MDYLTSIIFFGFLYGILVASLNLASGYTRFLSITHAGFFGIGAYAVAIMQADLHIAAPFALIIALGITAVLALPVGLAVWRLSEEEFLLATLAVGAITLALMRNCESLTGGIMGKSAGANLSILGPESNSRWLWCLVAAAMYALVHWFVRRLAGAPFGRALVALGEDEIVIKSYGKNAGFLKLQAFILGSMLTAFAGFLIVEYVNYIEPSMFSLNESIFVLTIMIIGGLGSLWGGLAASMALVWLPELLRFVGVPNGNAANVRQIIFGTCLVVVIAVRWGAVQRRKNSPPPTAG